MSDAFTSLLSTSVCHVIVVFFISIQSAATNTEHSDSELGDVMRDLQRKLKRELEQSGADAKRAQKDRDKVEDWSRYSVMTS